MGTESLYQEVQVCAIPSWPMVFKWPVESLHALVSSSLLVHILGIHGERFKYSIPVTHRLDSVGIPGF